MAAKFASFVQLQKSEKLLQKSRIYLLQINEKKFHLPKHTKYSKEGISCLLYVNNIKLWTEREPGTDSLIYKDNIKMSYKQQ